MSSSEEFAPPGGPQRQDSTGAGGQGLAGQDTGADREAPDSHEDEHGGTLPESSPPSAGESHDRQEENAETSLDQPST